MRPLKLALPALAAMLGGLPGKLLGPTALSVIGLVAAGSGLLKGSRTLTWSVARLFPAVTSPGCTAKCTWLAGAGATVNEWDGVEPSPGALTVNVYAPAVCRTRL